ncbi:MAG: hypothetical protein ABI885_07415 [Gammaproteobacteria bacterium]
MNTTWEKFQGATLSLARSGALKERITQAYRNHLSRIDEAELPKELREDFRSVHRALTRERPLVRGDDAFRATIRKMSNDEAEEVATSVVRMFCALPRASVTQIRPLSTASVVPMYIAESLAAEA